MVILCKALVLAAREILYVPLENWPVMMEMDRFSGALPNLEKIFLYILLYCKFSHSIFCDTY